LSKSADPKKLYEGMFLFDSNLATKDWPGLERHVQDLLERNSAELVHSERWPDRKLCYEVKGCKKGTYYLTYFKAPPEAVQGLRRDCQLSERVLRVLVLYDEALVEECEKRLRREITGSPEEIEEQRERLRRETLEPALRSLPGRAAVEAASLEGEPEGGTEV